MRVVELLGPSGVGKTFLYRNLFDQKAERKYMNVTEACIAAAKGLQLNVGFTKSYLYYLMLHSGLFNHKKYGLSKRLLFSNNKAVNNSANNYQIAFSLLKKYLVQSNAVVYARRMDDFKRCVALDEVLNKHLPANEVVFFDEGMLHHHHGLNQNVTAQYTLDEIKQDRALTPYAAVFCELPFEKLMAQVKKRRQEGIQTFSHKGLSDAALEAYVKQNVKEYQDKLQVLDLAGVPVLTINTASNLELNLKAVHSFINNLSYHD